MNIDEGIKSLDELEIKRKADYSIWGYLYQFDLTLCDMLCHNTEHNLFNDVIKESQATYQVEVIEDYIKTYSTLEEQCIRIAQVKYSSTTSKFDYWDVVVDLYYDYLYLDNLIDSNINIKCGLFFNLENKIEFTKDQVVKNAKKEINDFISVYLKEVAVGKVNNKDKEKDNHNKRVVEVFGKYHTSDKLNDFISNSLIVSWKESRLDLIKNIKEKLNGLFNDEFEVFSGQNKKDVLYALAINFIINGWQNKKKRKDIVKIKINDLIKYIKEVSFNEELIISSLLNINIRNAIEETIEEIKWNLSDEGLEEEKINKLLNDSYYKYSDKLYEQLQVILKDKNNRYKLINTISLKENKSQEEYSKLNSIEEYGYFSTKQLYLKSYIKRLLKFINNNIKNDICNFDNINIMLNLENEMILFEHPSEKRECILLPKTYDNPKFEHGKILGRIKDSNIKPKVWYFDKIDVPKTTYDLNILKPGDDESVYIKHPYNDHYYIECMKCLNENMPFDNTNVNCIFGERCIINGEDKNRKSID
ncbi:hypothetical protein [Clostridium beijerinckii]|uniref:hypothetical protein n=1 Tax=Clostridium beijerinckii TaxID=1520 RepID=UPI00136131CF|nr:hypothetical protein [Clostridium beijerinckii]MZK48996.1 hypothetical protein [Clostridium beijerinckii]MZK57371.1 hypothetical protein [Clostridium beijerinckii]MZK67582.1 hypothetical protein [Clostridium beijerinckii]MZK72667.1 hypothetical protein [Clostridium beijerinckii]MZK82263.1 hypothetical protein [Clostridium beijerinckii]